MDRFVWRRTHVSEHHVVTSDAKKCKADNEHSRDRTAAEGDVERRVYAFGSRFGRSHVCANRDEHADVPGQR